MVRVRVPDHADPRQQHHQHGNHQPRGWHGDQETARQPHQLAMGVDIEYFLLPVHVLRTGGDVGVEEVLAEYLDEQDYDHLGSLFDEG